MDSKGCYHPSSALLYLSFLLCITTLTRQWKKWKLRAKWLSNEPWLIRSDILKLIRVLRHFIVTTYLINLLLDKNKCNKRVIMVMQRPLYAVFADESWSSHTLVVTAVLASNWNGCSCTVHEWQWIVIIGVDLYGYVRMRVLGDQGDLMSIYEEMDHKM